MTRIASHRGGTLEYGDSTPAGFRATAQMAVEEVEFDLHPTADGAIIVHHDATLDKTTDSKGAIVTMTKAQVCEATINCSGGAHPLTLPQLCAIFRDSPVDFRCEIKPGPDGLPYPGFVAQVVDALEGEGMVQRTTFSSFLIATLDDLALTIDRPRLWLVSPPVLRQLGPKAMLELAQAYEVPEIGVHVDTADAALRAQVQDAGLDFGVWAAHTADQIDAALDLGVKVFTTDRPSLAIARRAARTAPAT
ncbi:MAG: glycerophosphodiester phosphodiesterase [Rhodobacteraceae bacterium]|nr:glycerophosphodiester phosphodiesterase [Paracoccaceae bacterium]